MNPDNMNPIATETDTSKTTSAFKGSSPPSPTVVVELPESTTSSSQDQSLPIPTPYTATLSVGVVKSAKETVKLPKAFAFTHIRSKEEVVARIKEDLSHRTDIGCGVVKRIEFGNTESMNALLFSLESSIEYRKTSWSYRLFEGKYDPPLMGPAPKMDSITVVPSDYFRNFQFSTPIPHTDFLVRCDSCNGFGHIPCESCQGIGHTTAGIYFNCLRCHGTGNCACPKCAMKGQIVVFVDLQLNFVNYQQHTAIGGGGVSPSRLWKCEKNLLWSQEADCLLPPTDFPDPAYVAPINELFNGATKKGVKYLRQRFSVFEIPVTKVSAVLDGKDFEVLVFGEDFQLSFVNSPFGKL